MADGRGYHAGSKRPPTDPDVPVFERLELTPLGGGNEVRSRPELSRATGRRDHCVCYCRGSSSGL